MTIEFVYVHGWGFNGRFWDRLAEKFPDYRAVHVDLGFFGLPFVGKKKSGTRILIGHSLGFVHGLKQNQDWDGWIAINSFPRFVIKNPKPGCVTAAQLRDMRRRLQTQPEKTLHDFYRHIGAEHPAGMPDFERLREGLDELRDYDVEETLTTMDVPGLALAGRNDPLVPVETSEALGRVAKNGGLVMHEDMGHLLPQTAPAWCALAIANFVTTCFDNA